jgi:hypothetical protein
MLAEVFRVSSQSLHSDAGVIGYLKLGHGRLLPHSFQVIIHLSSFFLTLNSLSY